MLQLRECAKFNALSLPEYLRHIKNLVHLYLERFPQDEEFLGHLPRQLEFPNESICLRGNFSGHLTGGALILDATGQEVLLIYHKFLNRWLQPGGHLDPAEHPAQGAYRECLEETGLAQVMLHPWHQNSLLPLDIDSHQIPSNPKKQEFFHYHHDFLYVFQLESNPAKADGDAKKINLQLEEVTDYKWVALAEFYSGNYGKRLARVAKKLEDLSD